MRLFFPPIRRSFSPVILQPPLCWSLFFGPSNLFKSRGVMSSALYDWCRGLHVSEHWTRKFSIPVCCRQNAIELIVPLLFMAGQSSEQAISSLCYTGRLALASPPEFILHLISELISFFVVSFSCSALLLHHGIARLFVQCHASLSVQMVYSHSCAWWAYCVYPFHGSEFDHEWILYEARGLYGVVLSVLRQGTSRNFRKIPTRQWQMDHGSKAGHPASRDESVL